MSCSKYKSLLDIQHQPRCASFLVKVVVIQYASVPKVNSAPDHMYQFCLPNFHVLSTPLFLRKNVYVRLYKRLRVVFERCQGIWALRVRKMHR